MIPRRAFTLVEVLMAVLILGIGLLGLGAVLPAVVKQQQASTQSIQGSLAMNAAQASLRVGTRGRNEVQRLTLTFNLDPTTRAVPAGAAYTLTFAGATTAEVPVVSAAAAPGAVEEALASLDVLVGQSGAGGTLGGQQRTFTVAGSASVSGAGGTLTATIVYDVEFVGRMGGARVEVLEARGMGGVNATVARTVAGQPAFDASLWTALARIDPDGPGAGALQHSAGLPATLLPNDASWVVLPVETRTGTARERGATLLGVDASGAAFFPADRSLSIPMAERLQPSETAGVRSPQYVWDVAARRVGPRRQSGQDRFGVNYTSAYQPPEYTSVQTVVFLRRVDGRLEAPANSSVFAALLARVGTAGDLRWPVSLRNGAPVQPTNDGLVAGRTYSLPLAWSAEYIPTRVGPDGLVNRDLITLIDDTTFIQPVGVLPAMPGKDEAFQMAAKPGQILVDNLGNVYTVVGPALGAGYAYTLRVSPPVPPEVLETDSNPEAGAATLRQILFVPEGAVAARVEVANP